MIGPHKILNDPDLRDRLYELLEHDHLPLSVGSRFVQMIVIVIIADVLAVTLASVTALPGVGPKVAKLIARLTGRDDGARIADLLFHLPSGVVDRRARWLRNDKQE